MHQSIMPGYPASCHQAGESIRFCLVLLVLLMPYWLTGIAPAATYYVSLDGDDSNAGSLEYPWKTPQKAATQAAAGDTVYLRGGTYRVGQKTRAMVNFAHSGTATMPIRMLGYPGETVILSGMIERSQTSEWTAESKNIYYTDDLSGSDFDGDIPVVVQNGVVLEPRPTLKQLKGPGQTYFDSQVKRLYVRANGDGNPGSYQMEISQAESVFKFDSTDQYIWLENLTIQGAYYGIQCQPNGGHRTFRHLNLRYFKADAVKFHTTGNRNDLIEHCRFSDFGDYGIDTYGSTDQTFRYNEFTRVLRWKSGGAIKSLADGSNHLVEGNYIHDLGGLGYEAALELREAKFIRVVNNLIVNSNGGAIYLYGDNTTLQTPVPDPTVISVEIVNNTIYHTKEPAIWLMKNCRDVIILNNLVYQLSGDSVCLRVDNSAEDGLFSDYNDFFRGKKPIKWLRRSYSLSKFQEETNHDLHSLSMDPYFADLAQKNFRLSPSSPVIDIGESSHAPSLDFDQSERPNGEGFDLGAFEY